MAWRVRPKVVVSVAVCVTVCILVWALSEQYLANDKFFDQFEYSCNLQESREFIESLVSLVYWMIMCFTFCAFYS